MQTFLPYRSFQMSASVLDRSRLGKQRVEVLQILKALNGRSGWGWSNHPAVRMWRGYKSQLIHYGVAICDEWTRRGYRDTCREKILAFRDSSEPIETSLQKPTWLTEEFCLAHRSNLVRKNPSYYRPIFGDVPDDLPYIWPNNRGPSRGEHHENL